MNGVMIMKRISGSGFLIKVLVVLLIASMTFPGAVYSLESAKLIEDGQHIGPGTYYRNMNYITPNGNFMVNMIESKFDSEYIRIGAADSGSSLTNKPVSYQALQKTNDTSRVIGAINGDFFDMTTIKGLTFGTSIIGGEIKTAVKTSTVLGVTDKGDCFIDTLNMEGAAAYKYIQYPVTSVNRLRWADQTVIYTPFFGKTTVNTVAGTDIIVRGVDLPLKAGKVYTGKIESIIPNSKIAEIPEDGVVISMPAKAFKQLAGVPSGAKMSFFVNFDKKDLDFAVSGSPRLLEGGEISPKVKERADALQRHPRTAVGIKDNKIYMITVDGRQPGYSDGMTLYELVDFLLGQGVEDAINLDGGGSTTMAVRKQGDAVAKLANNPSDGRERYVGNSLQLISEAPLSEPAILRFNDISAKIFTNSSFKPSMYALDKYYNLLSGDIGKIRFGIDSKTSKIAADGTYSSGSQAGKGYLYAAYGNTQSKMLVETVDNVSSLTVANDFVLLDPGEKVQLQVKAFDEKGEKIIISPSAVKWAVEGRLGTVDAGGVFTAGNNNGHGKITASAGTVTAAVGAKVGKTPVIVADFGTLDNVEAKSIRSDAAIRHNQKEEPVRIGSISLKLDYDFENTAGTSAAYVTFKQPVKILGKPIELGVWVHGDGGNHWLRGNYINSAGEKKVFDFTKSGGLNWKGWKYVYVELPQNEKYPIALEQIYLAETAQENKNSGSIYFDDVMAIYKLDKDYYDPEIVSVLPEGQEIGVIAADRGYGIDPASIMMYINDAAVRVKFEPETGKISYTPAKPLKKGEYNVRVSLKDKIGHSLNPEFTYTYIVK